MISQNSKIVITGATGFVGRRLVKLLAKTKYKNQITCLIWNKTNDREKEGRDLIKYYGFKTIEVDLVTGEGLADLKLSPEIIIHLAASVDTTISDHQCNDIGTQNLIAALKPRKDTHIIFMSTIAAMSGRKNCKYLIDDKTELAPANEYGRSKFRAEQFLKAECVKRKFSLTIFRPNTICGSGMREGSLFNFLKALIKNNSIFTRLNWPGLTSSVGVDAVAEAIMLILFKKPLEGTFISYILHSSNMTLAQMCKLLYQKMGREYKPIILPYWVWLMGAKLRRWLFHFEGILPANLYNYLWRCSIIIDNVSAAQPGNFNKLFPQWKPKSIAKIIEEEIE